MQPDSKVISPEQGRVKSPGPVSPFLPPSASRRSFLQATASLAALATSGPFGQALLGQNASAAVPVAKPSAESIVQLLYQSLKPEQRKQVCFPWDYTTPAKGLLRTRVENNWRITKPAIKGEFYTRDQQAMIRAIFEGMTNPDWHARFDKQLKDDVGGFGNRQGIAIFGEPGNGKSEFVLTSRHPRQRHRQGGKGKHEVSSGMR